VLIEVTHVEEVGSLEVGSSGKVSLSEKVVLVLLAVEAGTYQRGFWVLAINVSVVEADSGSYCQRWYSFLK